MNEDKLKRLYKNVMLIIVVALITFILTSVFLYKKLDNSTYALGNIKGLNSKLIQKIYMLQNIIDEDYIAEADEEKLTEGAIKGYVAAIGDEYTEYFTKSEMEDFKQDTEGEYVGIGIYMLKNTEDNEIVVYYPIEGSPAEKAGIQSGDVIKKVDDIEYDAEDFDTIATNIKGKEGTFVKIEVERNGEKLTFDVERKKIELYPMKYEILENNIGYINVQSFDAESSKKFKTVYNELKKNNIKGLIIDLRNNGGGIVEEALRMAEYIVEKDDIILVTKDREEKEKIEKSTKKPIVNVPVVVLVNQNSASASEILTAALKENNKATIVGETTYGKGVIQELITLSDGSGIKVTIEEYYTPNKNRINKVGIEPNETVELPKETSIYNIERKHDIQLRKAIEILQK